MKKLPLDFYDRDDVILIARELLGKIVITQFSGILTSGRIMETEAYIGISDRASHSYDGKRTTRNEHMYAGPGYSYVYICYGIHQMLNIVTNKKGIPDAVLIRALEPLSGIEQMLLRTGKNDGDKTLTRGPGNVGKAMGISSSHSGLSFRSKELFIADDLFILQEKEIGSSSRIGVESAGEAALYPYRFYIRGNRFVSGRPVK